ncbi:hypothetical protein F5B22DRAFT_33435 [Xylaria bambusicola]|uniref:uncharacterized protein n=1 Tax=Xylaria bambusicola TaxID=326684 RepID=UPI002008A0E8|nr:uncharacterized protein F5B22DRAFT_33435 [Xylaria bambusicola]KAI0520990.1 hypothetical protein F5B22DRAFT_33435 [Xylaria bambusicola]
MTLTVRKDRRYESGPDASEVPRRSCSSSLDNPGATSYTSHSSCAICLGIQTYSLYSIWTIPGHPLSSERTSQVSKRRRGSSPSAGLRQPIGIVCCHCRYHSSGSDYSNPNNAECPHRTLPRCRNCPIIFTAPRMRYGVCEDG